MDRRTEIRELLGLTPEQVVARAGSRLTACDDLDVLHARFAAMIAAEIRQRNEAGVPTRLILPVGPVGQYPILAATVNRERISLANCWFFFMDENCDEGDRALPATHPLSFKGTAARQFLDRLEPGCGLRPAQVVFPDEGNVGRLADMIEAAGGIDSCYGGVGIHGHVAFNEPEPGVAASGPRLVRLNDYSLTINAIRARVGGNLECFPRTAYTLGMRQILEARRIELFCRNGCEFDWANTVLRLALFGSPGDDYPVTHVRGPHVHVTTDRVTLATPANLI